ncbi:MAG: hypothetical protein JEZ14_25755 [Marinilabiliaceae bacterium]|nr:hypothetical protein [Marinilabiliaceae bacterium]
MKKKVLRVIVGATLLLAMVLSFNMKVDGDSKLLTLKCFEAMACCIAESAPEYTIWCDCSGHSSCVCQAGLVTGMLRQ